MTTFDFIGRSDQDLRILRGLDMLQAESLLEEGGAERVLFAGRLLERARAVSTELERRAAGKAGAS